MSFIYKMASEPYEFEQILQLNYQTFVEEIPQHEKNDSRELIDKFHDENKYIICLNGEQLVGMICVRSNRPFSLDAKIGLVEHHLPVRSNHPCEIRLLAVHPDYRNGRVFMGLAQALIRFCLKMGYDLALISGTTLQQKLYKQLGFQPFAYLTGSEEAQFQPMYLTKEIFDESIAGRLLKEPVNFLPGPSTISKDVQTAFSKRSYSHRSRVYEQLYVDVQKKLQILVNASRVQIVQGTGTMANDMIAGQLSLRRGKGLILVNGEFGRRLVDHGIRWGLSFDQLKFAWGSPFNIEKVDEKIRSNTYQWIWAVHCETSTGVLNSLDDLKEICQREKIELCLDCVSSIGAVPVDLLGVSLASGVSGKSIGSYSGLAFVFHDRVIEANRNLPKYLDLGAYEEANGVPYTQSSNLLEALNEALKKYQSPEKIFKQIEERYLVIRERLEASGLKILSDLEYSSPVIMSIPFPEGMNASTIGDGLFINGFNLHYESSYLREKNWLQISCNNDMDEKEMNKMLEMITEMIHDKAIYDK